MGAIISEMGDNDGQQMTDEQHFLVINEPGEDWQIEHPASCLFEEETWGSADSGVDRSVIHWQCNIGVEVTHAGIDSLDDDWQQLAAGRYPIAFWSEEHRLAPHVGIGSEWSAGLELLATEPVGDGQSSTSSPS